MTCEDLKLTELLRGELEPPETQRILAHLEQCRTCQERIHVMAVLETRFKTESPTRAAPRWPYMASAAAALVMALILAVYHFGGAPVWMVNRDHSIVAEPYPYFPLELRSGDSDPTSDRLRESAFDAYVAGDYLKANAILEEITSEDDPELTFFLGVTHYLLGNTESAMAHLRVSATDPRWKAPSRWYLANLLLREGDTASAIELLESLQDRAGEFSEESTGLLRVLKP